MEVGNGMGYRFLAFAGPAVWHMNAGRDDATLLLPFTFAWTLFFGVLLARTMIKVRKRDENAANRLLRNDFLAVCCICFLPLALDWIPGKWGLFAAQMAMVPFLVKNWNLLRRLYQLPEKPRRQKQ